MLAPFGAAAQSLIYSILAIFYGTIGTVVPPVLNGFKVEDQNIPTPLNDQQENQARAALPTTCQNNMPIKEKSSKLKKPSVEILCHMNKVTENGNDDVLTIIFLYIGKERTELIKLCYTHWNNITNRPDFIFNQTYKEYNDKKYVINLFKERDSPYFFTKYIEEMEKENYNSSLLLEILNGDLANLNQVNKTKVFKKIFKYTKDDENYRRIICKILDIMSISFNNNYPMDFVASILNNSKKINKYYGPILESACKLLRKVEDKEYLFNFIRTNKGPYTLLQAPYILLQEPATYEEVLTAVEEGFNEKFKQANYQLSEIANKIKSLDASLTS